MYTVYTVQYIVNTIQCTVYIVQYTLYLVKYTIYSVHCTVYFVHCTLYSIQCTLYGLQWAYIVYTVYIQCLCTLTYTLTYLSHTSRILLPYIFHTSLLQLLHTSIPGCYGIYTGHSRTSPRALPYLYPGYYQCIPRALPGHAYQSRIARVYVITELCNNTTTSARALHYSYSRVEPRSDIALLTYEIYPRYDVICTARHNLKQYTNSTVSYFWYLGVNL